MITSNRKGQIAVSKAQVRAIELGFNPCIPVMDCRYDLVLDDGEKLWRVQVKSTDHKPSHSTGAVTAQLTYETRQRRRVVRYNEDEVDALVVYIPKIDRLCWFLPEIFAGKSALTIRIEPSKNKQKSRIILASDYFW